MKERPGAWAAWSAILTEFVIRLADERGRGQEKAPPPGAGAGTDALRGDGGGAAGAVHPGRVLRLLGEGTQCARRELEEEGEAGDLPDLQPAVSDVDPRGASDSGISGAAG